MSEKIVECEIRSTTPQNVEINLLRLWLVVWPRRKMIFIIIVISVLLTVIGSFFMTNVYQSAAVITPVAPQGGGVSTTSALASALTQQLGGPPGLIMPGSSSAQEIVALLKSDILLEEVIKKYNLMPILFGDLWDPKKMDWKRESTWRDIPGKTLKYLLSTIQPARPGTLPPKEEGVPTMWEALKLMDKDIITITDDTAKTNTITIAVEFKDPLVAHRIAEYIITVLTDHMSSEAKRVAETNLKYLEGQLNKTADPMIKQNLYNLIAQQFQTSMMAEVKENFGFKVIDPPRLPEEKAKPRRAIMAVLSLFVSFFLAISIAFFLEYLGKTKIMLAERKKQEQMEKEGGISH